MAVAAEGTGQELEQDRSRGRDRGRPGKGHGHSVAGQSRVGQDRAEWAGLGVLG